MQALQLLAECSQAAELLLPTVFTGVCQQKQWAIWTSRCLISWQTNKNAKIMLTFGVPVHSRDGHQAFLLVLFVFWSFPLLLLLVVCLISILKPCWDTHGWNNSLPTLHYVVFGGTCTREKTHTHTGSGLSSLMLLSLPCLAGKLGLADSVLWKTLKQKCILHFSENSINCM